MLKVAKTKESFKTDIIFEEEMLKIIMMRFFELFSIDTCYGPSNKISVEN